MKRERLLIDATQTDGNIYTLYIQYRDNITNITSAIKAAVNEYMKSEDSKNFVSQTTGDHIRWSDIAVVLEIPLEICMRHGFTFIKESDPVTLLDDDEPIYDLN